MRLLYLLLLFLPFILACNKDDADEGKLYNYSGIYKNTDYTELLLKEYTPGIYSENEVPEELKNLSYGRIEIDFRYDGGGINSFMPLFYYGSVNKNSNDNAVEEPQFHLAVEIGHYNVIPSPVDYFFYTICTYRYPRYCRDSFSPVTAGQNYTFVMDKQPDGIFLQLKQNHTVINSFPHAYFPDSTQMFFRDVTSYTEAHKGDSLQNVLMVGYGFAGIEPGLHQFNGEISGFRIYQYKDTEKKSGYELEKLKNQHCVSQRVNYVIRDKNWGDDKSIRMNYDFWPYKYESGNLVPNGEKQTIIREVRPNNYTSTWNMEKSDIGFYQIYLQTLDNKGNVIHYTSKPFDLWIYPEEWEFEY